MSTDMTAAAPTAHDPLVPAAPAPDEEEALPTMGSFNIPTLPKHTPKLAEALLFETTKLRVHNLPPDKAVSITQALITEIKPFYYRDQSGTKIQFDPRILQVVPGLDDKNRKTHSAIIQFHPDATENGAADLYGLELLRAKLDDGIYPTRWNHARANDRSTVVKFDFVINEKKEVGKEKLITPDEATIELKRIWKTRGYEWKRAWSIARSVKSMTLTGHAACSDPRGIAEFIKDSPVQLLLPPPNDCFWKCNLSIAADFIPVTYGTTIATYTAGRYVSDTQLANDLHNLACDFNKDRPKATQRWFFRTGRSPCGKWFLCDPSHLDLAAYICSIPNITGDFYELAHNINSDFPIAFKLEEINRKKAEKTAAYNATQVVKQGKQFVNLGDDALREIRKGNKKIHALDVGLQEANKRMRRIEQGQDATNMAISNTVNMVEEVRRDRILDRRITNLEIEQARLEARRDGLDVDDDNRLLVEKLLTDIRNELATIRPPAVPLIAEVPTSHETPINLISEKDTDVEMETEGQITAIAEHIAPSPIQSGNTVSKGLPAQDNHQMAGVFTSNHTPTTPTTAILPSHAQSTPTSLTSEPVAIVPAVAKTTSSAKIVVPLADNTAIVPVPNVAAPVTDIATVVTPVPPAPNACRMDNISQGSSPLTEASIDMADPLANRTMAIPETPVSKTRIGDLRISGDAAAENDAGAVTRTTRRMTRREQSAQQHERAGDSSPTRQGNISKQ